jgi:hypothetical protein
LLRHLLRLINPIVVLDKSVFFQGEAVSGKIILGKFDPSLKAVCNYQWIEHTSYGGQAKFFFRRG